MLKNEPFVFLLRKLWRFSPDRHGKIILSAVLQIATVLIELIPPIILAYILNLIQKEGVTSKNIWFISGIFIFNYFILDSLIPWIIWLPSRIMERKTAFLARVNYRDYLFNGVLSLNIDWHNNHKSGNMIDKINKATDAIFDFGSNLFRIYNVLIGLIGTIVAIIFFNWRFIGIVAIFVVLTLWNIKKWDRILIPQYKLLNNKENIIQEKIFDNISNITTIKILQLRKIVRKIIHNFSLLPLKLDNKKNINNEAKWCSTGILLDLFLVVIIIFYIWWNYKNNILLEIGTLAALFQYLSLFKDRIYSVAAIYNELMIKKTRVQNAEKLEKEFNKVLKRKTREKLPNNWKKIIISNLFFKYQDNKQQKHAIKIKDLKFQHGEKIALLGESGSGKTTFLKLLRGLYNLDELRIEVDSDKHKNNFQKLHNSSMLVPQEPEIFATTIKENINMHSGISTKKLEKFVNLAKFEKVLERLPQKWKSVVGEKGVNLSGGEKQRLALARALLFCQDKDIILLDESTSSVDSVNERIIYNNIFREFSQKTVFASIHKLNLISEFSRIILFENGEIVADGSFDELLKKSAKFKKLWLNYQESTNNLQELLI